MEYSPTEAWESPQTSEEIGGITLSRDEFYKQYHSIHSTVFQNPENWSPTNSIRKYIPVYFCERSAYKQGHINPLFPSIANLFLSNSSLDQFGSDDSGTFIHINNDYVLRNWRDETDTLHLTLMQSNNRINTIRQNIQLLIPHDTFLAQLYDIEDSFLAHNI